jgi:hypothetical protein
MTDCVPDHHATKAVTAHPAQELQTHPVGHHRVVSAVYGPQLVYHLATQKRPHRVRFTLIDTHT